MKNILIILLCTLLYSFNFKSERVYSIEKKVKNQNNQFYFIYKDKSKVEVRFNDNEIRIFNGKQIDVKIPYSSSSGNVLPFDALIVNNNLRGRNYFLYKKNILLLPVSEVNNRFNLIVINLDSGFLYKINNDDYLLPTSCPWFFFLESKGEIVTMNAPKREDATLIHYFKIWKNKIVHDKYKSILLNEELIDNENKLKAFVAKRI